MLRPARRGRESRVPVSDLDYETSQAGTAEAEPAHDAGSRQQYETAEPADHSYGEYTETDAEVQARIAGQDELPAPEESRQATWGDNPDYYDEAELGAEYDGDVDALLAGEDELPTPQESRQATWGDNPEYYDESDLASEYDGDLDALTAEDHALDGGEGQRDQAANETPPAAERLDGLPTDAPESSAVAPAEQEEHSPADTNERVTEPANENDQLGKDIAELQARLERLEHANQAEPTADAIGRERETAERSDIVPSQTRRWLSPSNEGLALGAAAAGGVLTTVSDYVPYLHADVAGIAASTLAVGAAAVTWMRAKGEAKHARRRTKD
jgi:hypothetical protein